MSINTMEIKDNILGCFVSSQPLVYGASNEEIKTAREQGELFRSYIWGEKGISNVLKVLKHIDYGKDMLLILFQFYVKPFPYLQQNLKEIENYRKNEKSIGIPIIVTDENFFSKEEKGRYDFLKQTILEKLDLLAEIIKKKKLDTNIELLKANIIKVLM